MNRRLSTIARDYFDALYTTDTDPWGFETSDYEKGKYQATLDALSRTHYRQALEIGCSIGVFTERLAPRCDRLLAIDASEIALDRARARCAAWASITFEARMVPDQFPEDRFDLIILSEMLYYLHAHDLDRVASRCIEALAPDGEIILCHWLGETDYPLTGAEASDRFAAALLTRLPVQTIVADETYRLHRLSPS